MDNKFDVVLLGVIFDPEKRQVLLGRRKDDPSIPGLTWCFPSGRLKNEEDVDKVLKQRIKDNTGYEVKNLGSIFARRFPERDQNIFQVFFLCEVFSGEERAGGDLEEVKWVDPEEIETLFQTSFHPVLKEYILSLK